MIEVRRATLDDKQAIFRFLSKAYADRARYKFPERWEWQFEKNPFRNQDELPVWIAVDDEGTVVGQTCAMIEPLKIGSDTYRLGWGADMFVLPAYRGQKLGHELQNANYEGNEIFMTLVMSEASRHLEMKLGGFAVDSVTVFRRPARFDAASAFAAFRKRLDSRWPGKVQGAASGALLRLLCLLRMDQPVGALINVGRAMRGQRLLRCLDSGVDVRQVREFDQAADRLWDAVSPQFHAIVQRSSAYLNWKYVRQPHMNYELFSASRSGRMCGYVILRKTRSPESNTGIIADLFAPPGDRAVIHTLLAFAVRHLKNQQVERIVAASSVDAYKSALLALGFKKTAEVTPVYKSRVVPVPAPGSWFLSRGDHDWDQYPYG